MFKDLNQAREAIITLARALPEREQKIIARTLSAKKKMSRKEKNKQRVLKDIAQGLGEIKEAKRTGKELPDLQDLLNELKGSR